MSRLFALCLCTLLFQGQFVNSFFFCYIFLILWFYLILCILNVFFWSCISCKYFCLPCGGNWFWWCWHLWNVYLEIKKNCIGFYRGDFLKCFASVVWKSFPGFFLPTKLPLQTNRKCINIMLKI